MPGRPELLGRQEPTLRVAPAWTRTEGDIAIDFGRACGYDPFPWQQNLLLDGLSLTDGPEPQWAASDVVAVVPRQQGKSAVMEMLVLYCLFVGRYRTILYTAHRSETAKSFFGRVQGAIRRTPMLQSELMADRSGGIRTGNGQWEIRLRSGQIMSFRTRTNDGGRGLDAVPLLIVDEAQNYTDDQMAALQPVTSSATNPQIWYAGSAGGRHSTVLGGLVRDAEQRAPRLVYHGWHASEDDDPAALATWAKSNPSLGAVVEVGTLASAQRRFPASKFAREHLGIGDYPREAGEEWVIPETAWTARLDPDSEPVGRVVFVADSTVDLEHSTISVAGRRADGDIHVEVVAHDRGTTWLGPRLAELATGHPTLGIAVDPRSPSASTVLATLKDLRDAGRFSARVHELTSEEVKSAWTWLYLAAKRPPEQEAQPGVPGVWHRGAAILTDSLAGASVRRLLDQQTWSRQGEGDSSPIISATQAGYAVQILEQELPPPPLPRMTGPHPGPARPGPGAPLTTSADLMTARF